MATFYGTAAGARAHWDQRDYDVPTTAIDDDVVNSWLLRASEWFDARYRSSFNGLKVGGRGQEREWPRTGASDIYGYAVDSSFVPLEVTSAIYEAALKVGEGVPLMADYTASKYKRVSIDGALSVEYADRSGIDVQPMFAAVAQFIAPLLTGGLEDNNPLSGEACRV